MKEELKLEGIPIVPGKAVGKAYYVGRTVATIERKGISEHEVGKEIVLFNIVRSKAKKIYHEILIQAKKDDTSSTDFSVLNVYCHILDDPAFIGRVVHTVSSQLVNLETAVRLVSNDFIKRFDSAQTSYFKERGSDMVEVCEKLVALINEDYKKKHFVEPVILIVPRVLVPSDILTYDLSMVKGIVALNAGTTSHATILARSYEIPVVSGIKNIKKHIKQNCSIYMDTSQGAVFVNPSNSRLRAFKSYQVIYESSRKLSEKWKRPVYTKDGVQIEVLANVAFVDDVGYAHQYGADGVGLVRSEYLYYLKNNIPSEKEQRDYFESLFEKAKNIHLTIRLLDIGADKIPGFVELPKEINPSLGWRGIRILLKQKQLFRDHVSAIMKASKGRPYSLMFPMVSTWREYKESKDFVQKTAEDLSISMPACGVLLEVPLAILEMNNYLNDVDFLSIGTNDLIQYLLAADRNNPNVNYLYNPLEPAFLRILKEAIAGAKDRAKPISICGEMAGSPLYTILLVGLGLTRFSVSPHNIPAIKEIISNISYSEAKEPIDHLLSLSSPDDMNKFLLKTIQKNLGDSYADLEHLFDVRGLSLFAA